MSNLLNLAQPTLANYLYYVLYLFLILSNRYFYWKVTNFGDMYWFLFSEKVNQFTSTIVLR